MQKQIQRQISLKKEVEILQKMGLEGYEIEYILFLKQKQDASDKWS